MSTTPGIFHHERSKTQAHDHVVFTSTAAPASRPASSSTTRAASASCCFRRGGRWTHPLLAGLGIEPTGNALRRRALSESVQGQEDAAQIGAARSAADCRDSATSTLARRCGGPSLSPRRTAGSIASRPGTVPTAPIVSRRRCGRSSPRQSWPAARHCATMSMPTARSAISSTAFKSTIAKARPARKPRVPRHSRAHRPGRPLDFLLPGLPAMS